MCQAPHGPWVDYTEQAQWGQMKSGRCQDMKFQLYPDQSLGISPRISEQANDKITTSIK